MKSILNIVGLVLGGFEEPLPKKVRLVRPDLPEGMLADMIRHGRRLRENQSSDPSVTDARA